MEDKKHINIEPLLKLREKFIADRDDFSGGRSDYQKYLFDIDIKIAEMKTWENIINTVYRDVFDNIIAPPI